MSNSENSGIGGNASEKGSGQIAIQKTSGTATFPIDLAPAKIAHVKPSADNKVGSVLQGTAQQATATFRTISAGQQSQVRVVMPPGATLMPQAMIKQIDGTAAGVRTQITAIPSRTISQASITVTRPATPTAYLPRAGVTATNIQAQRLVTPIRTPTPPTVTGLSGNYVRGTTVARNSSSPATTVISPTAGTWMASTAGQVQLIRAINHQPRQRLVSASSNNAGVVAVGQTTNLTNTQVQQQNQGNIQSATSQPQQSTFVATLATVLPQRPQTATLVYSNVSNSQSQQYNTASTQRYTVAATLPATQRQMRPIQLSNRTFSTAKIGVGGMNATSISIRAPNIPVLAPTLSTGGATANIQARSTTGNVNLSTTSLSTTRIIQLQQQQPGTGAQQLISSTGRLANNVIFMSSGGARGMRPQTNISAKVQPPLTITQLDIGKLTGNQSSASPLSTSSLQGATITPLSASNVVASVSGGNIIQTQGQQSQPQSISVNVSNSQQPITQIVNVNQGIGTGPGGQIITTQNVSGSATVVPLAITSRAANVITGTIPPIKTATAPSASISVPPIAKVLPQQQHHQVQQQNSHVQSSQGGQQTTDIITSTQQHHQPTSVYIHTRPPSSGNAGTATVISNAFMPQAGSFIYESVPANSVTVSTGILSLTTTTVTSSVSNTQPVTSTNLPTGLVTSIPYNPSSNTFTLVPTGNRSIGQVQIPVSSSGGPAQTISQIQAVPVRFTPQHISEQQGAISAQANISQQQNASQQQQTQQQAPHHHQIIAMSQPQQSQQGPLTVQQTPILIPVQTSIKLPAAAVVAAPSPPRLPNVAPTLSAINSAFARKRDNDGSPVRVAKNLAPTLMSMVPKVSNLVSDCSKDRDRERERERVASPHSRPGSSGGSTTVSANSSPGVDQQMSEELTSMAAMNMRVSNDSHFNPINDMYPNHQNAVGQTVRGQAQPHHLQHQTSTGSSNGNLETTPRKKPRRSTDSQTQQSNQQSLSHHHLNSQQNQISAGSQQSFQGAAHEGHKQTNNNSVITSSNKENAKPTEIIIKKPRSCNLLDGYKQNWKAANNHFQRYSDVKPREERRPTVMDLANQAHVVQKINGWKIYHLSAQMEDLCELETQVYEKLSTMLKQLETQGQTPDTDRVNDLIKGNMQRSKIIVDGVTEARSQIMKIFDHKSHVSDIIHRCASKRNFKKREKT